jgi:hypothetical protein
VECSRLNSHPPLVFTARLIGSHLSRAFSLCSESDVFNSVNIGCTAGFEMFWTTRGQPYYASPLGAGQVCVRDHRTDSNPDFFKLARLPICRYFFFRISAQMQNFSFLLCTLLSLTVNFRFQISTLNCLIPNSVFLWATFLFRVSVDSFPCPQRRCLFSPARSTVHDASDRAGRSERVPLCRADCAPNPIHAGTVWRGNQRLLFPHLQLHCRKGIFQKKKKKECNMLIMNHFAFHIQQICSGGEYQ